MATKSNNPPINTIEITNFGGRLTRILNGDLNSGFANFVSSFGYDPFSKPNNLTWLEQPTDITPQTANVLLLSGFATAEGGQPYVYALGTGSVIGTGGAGTIQSGTLLKIQPNTASNPNVDSVVGIASVGGDTYNYGGSIQPYNYRAVSTSGASSTVGVIFVGGDNQVRKINSDGSGETSVIGSNQLAGYVQNVYRPLQPFQGLLLFGNGPTFGAIDSTNTVISPVTNPGSIYSAISPQLPTGSFITDLTVSKDGNYLNITASGTGNIQPTSFTVNITEQVNATNSALYQWNGSGNGLGTGAITTVTNLGSFSTSAVQAYLGNDYLFSNDSFGASISNGIQKILTLPNNTSPFPGSIAVNGNFLTFLVPEFDPVGNRIVASLFYFGNLDGENQPGLWRVMKYITQLPGGFIVQTPFNMLVNNKGTLVNNTASSILTIGYGKHYLSTYSAASASATQYQIFRFLITPTGTGISQFGQYETQTQLFSKRITVKQIRVYTEATQANNSFAINFIGSDGNVITNAINGGTFLYTFAAGSDPTLLQGSLERIDFNPEMKDVYALGIRITNVGTKNMTIKKIEVDYTESGK